MGKKKNEKGFSLDARTFELDAAFERVRVNLEKRMTSLQAQRWQAETQAGFEKEELDELCRKVKLLKAEYPGKEVRIVQWTDGRPAEVMVMT